MHKMYIEEYLYTKMNPVLYKQNYTKIYKIYNFYVHLDTTFMSPKSPEGNLSVVL